MMDASYLGLGYYHHPNQLNPDGNQDESNAQAHAENSNQSAIDDYMNQYLQQCLKYHEEQESIRRQQQQAPPLGSEQPQQGHPPVNQHPQAQQAREKGTVHFISGGVFDIKCEEYDSQTRTTPEDGTGSSAIIKSESADDSQESSESDPLISTTLAASSSQIEMAAAQGRQRAQEILLRFQQQQEHLLYNQTVMTTTTIEKQEQEPEAVLSSYHAVVEPPQPSVFLEQRQRGVQREMLIRKQAMLKNFAYVAEKDRLRSHLLQGHIAHARQLEEQAKAQYEAATFRRQQMINSSLMTQAGIGSKKRKKAERLKEKEGHLPSKGNNNEDPKTVAIYISGLPTDGSLTSEAVKQLFGSFGTVQKVHFYVNKHTGEAKGDGLVIFNFEGRGNKESEFVEMVCSQVSGIYSYLSIDTSKTRYPCCTVQCSTEA